MNSSENIERLKQFLNDDRNWLDDKVDADHKDLIFRALQIKELKEEMDEYIPLVYGDSNVIRNNPNLYYSFESLRRNLNKHGAEVERTIGSYIDKLETKKKNRTDVLEDLMACCQNLEDEGNYHRAKRLHKRETSLKKDAVDFADKDYLNLKRKFVQKNWGSKDVSELETMLEHSDLLVDKGRYLEDEELIYHSAELSSEIAAVLNRTRAKRDRTRKAKIGFSAGIGLAVIALIQPYTPTEPVKNAVISTYKNITEFFKGESNKSNEVNSVADESIQQPYEEERRIQTN